MRNHKVRGNLYVGHSSFVAWSDKYYLRYFCLLDTIISWLGLLGIVQCLLDNIISECFYLLDS
jgi:hypothetical protein